jgi:hypothetical protein
MQGTNDDGRVQKCRRRMPDMWAFIITVFRSVGTVDFYLSLSNVANLLILR